jgi:hypothetical protein
LHVLQSGVRMPAPPLPFPPSVQLVVSPLFGPLLLCTRFFFKSARSSNLSTAIATETVDKEKEQEQEQGQKQHQPPLLLHQSYVASRYITLATVTSKSTSVIR